MHQLTLRIYYEDTDFGGVVYYANYLKFFERGRTEALRDLGVDQVALKAEGVVFVVRRALVEYLAPARFDDLVQVKTWAAELRRASAVMRQEIWRGDQRLVTADITIACMTSEGRPTRLPVAISGILAQLQTDH